MFKLNRQLGKLSIAALLGAALLLGTGCGVSKVDGGQVRKSSLLSASGQPSSPSGVETGQRRFAAVRPRRNGHVSAGWATPIEKEGLPNFHKVSDDLYRGAQPSAEGIRQLKEMGIKTIVNLRAFHSDRDEIGDIKIGYAHISFKTWHPEEEEIVRFLKIVTDKDKTPVFVHCQHGADRTGLMCAIYRVAVCGWSKEAAADEMINGGFGFHPIWKNLRNYLMKLDIETVKSKADIRNSN